MRRLASSLMVAGLLSVAAADARATFNEACCACVAQLGTSAGRPTPGVIPALFCGEFDNTEAAGARCEALQGSLTCFAEVAQAPPEITCGELLRIEGYACPSAAGAPVGRPWSLAGLAAALLAAGLFAVRRRARA